jgi:hypothetical protein
VPFNVLVVHETFGLHADSKTPAIPETKSIFTNSSCTQLKYAFDHLCSMELQ